MSSRAPSSRLAVLCSNCSLVTGCRLGSIPTPWHTSLSRFAVMLRISLCRIEGKPPLEQLSACSMVKCWPQTQWEGRYDGRHPYRKHRASLKAPLCRANPCSEMGKAESQLEAHHGTESSSRVLYQPRRRDKHPADSIEPHQVY